jgi:hypothetical protein
VHRLTPAGPTKSALAERPDGSPTDDLAAIGVQHLAGHAYGISRGEEDMARRDFVRLGRPAEEGVFSELRDVLGWKGGMTACPSQKM